MIEGYSCERQVLILISLLKQNKISKIVISPGTTNLNFVASLQYDGSFELYSCPDERSAAYMACGLAAESGEPVVITCTGATASREYLAGLTEAYHRKLPIIAVTATQSIVNQDNLSPQYIDRTVVPKDAVKFSVHIQHVRGATDEWDCMLRINRAFHELVSDGGGPVHINLTTVFSDNFSVKELPEYRKIARYGVEDHFPPINEGWKVAIVCGTRWQWSKDEFKIIESFCEKYNGIVICDHTSGYYGKYRVHPTIIMSQELTDEFIYPDLLIHIGEYSGDYYTYNKLMNCKNVWRISEDGIARDTFKNLQKIFCISERAFFGYYNEKKNVVGETRYYQDMIRIIDKYRSKEIELPFSNIWVAQNTMPLFPDNSVVQFGMSNTLRSWTFFDFSNDSIRTSANVGCRGIDGVMSTLVGASLVNPHKLYFAILGDLAFFYDINVLANRHVGNNVRILLMNSDGGTEFNLYHHLGRRTMGNDVGDFVAASGHNGKKSKQLIKHFARDLGYEYLQAHDKESFVKSIGKFVDNSICNKPMIFEVFLNHEDDNAALRIIRNLSGELNV